LAEQSPAYWRIWLDTDDVLAPVLEAALAPLGQSVARFEEKDIPDGMAKRWRIEAIADQEPDIAEVALCLAAAVGQAHGDMPDFHISKMDDVDWLALNRSQFPPITAGRFFIHGSFFDGTPPSDKHVVNLDVGPAFGSGTHETTRGCLLALDELLNERAFDHALDLGCGSGILALSFARATGKPVMASDLDPVAAETTANNAITNGLAHLVDAVAASGVAADGVQNKAPFDLIFANILAEPLIALAGDIEARLAPGGALILSGLLTRQQGDVMSAYRDVGLKLSRTIVLGEWSTMILGR
jgi:ribosomal protein L11 methyltransferase